MHLEEEEHINCTEVLRLARSYLKNIFGFYEFGGLISQANYIRMLQETNIINNLI
jgi:hypothetical protein